MIRMENWALAFIGVWDGFTAPELRPVGLSGTVFNDPRRADGTPITTSQITSVDDDVVTTASGRRYQLGEVDPAYAAAYPDAKARLQGFKESTESVDGNS